MNLYAKCSYFPCPCDDVEVDNDDSNRPSKQTLSLFCLSNKVISISATILPGSAEHTSLANQEEDPQSVACPMLSIASMGVQNVMPLLHVLVDFGSLPDVQIDSVSEQDSSRDYGEWKWRREWRWWWW